MVGPFYVQYRVLKVNIGGKLWNIGWKQIVEDLQHLTKAFELDSLSHGRIWAGELYGQRQTVGTSGQQCMKWIGRESLSSVQSLSHIRLFATPWTAARQASLDSDFAFLHFFSLGLVLISVSCIMSRTSFHSSSGTVSIRSRPLNLFSLPLYDHKGFDLGLTWMV